MQTIQNEKNRITLPKKYILSVFDIVTYKKTRKWMESTLYWEAKGTIKYVRHQNDK